MSVIFGTGALLTGALWAKGQWGVWWEWREPTLVSFLIIFLLYATYYPLRYAIEDRDRQARTASVFAITAGAFVPLNFLAVRLAEPFIHPRTFSSAGGLPPEMLQSFLVCLLGMGLLWWTLVRFELDSKASAADLARLRRALDPGSAPPAPARRSVAPVDRLGDPGPGLRHGGRAMTPLLALESNEGYVAGAYLVFVLLLLVYLAIMAGKLQRIQRQIRELADKAERS